MIDISRDINSLSNFKRNTPEFIRQMKETGHPVILTVNGQPEIVVQDAHAYQKLLEQVEHLRAIEGSMQDLKDVSEGNVRPLAQFMLAPQNPLPVGESGFARIFGQWPGDETDEEVAAALEEMS